MSKKALCFVLTIMITTSIVIQALTAASAEELARGDAVLTTETDGSTAASDTAATEPETTVSKAKYPVLTVNAISNYFGKTVAEYNEFTREVTVLYTLKSSKTLLSAEWSLSYDSRILTLDPEKNTPDSICPIMQNDALMKNEISDKGEGKLSFAATDLYMFDFTNSQSAFARIVFDVAPLTENDSEITKVDLTVDYLSVSEPNAIDGKSLSDKEIILVANGKTLSDSRTNAVSITKSSSLTPDTFVEPKSSSTDDQAATTAPTQPKVTKPTNPPKPKAVPKPADDKSIWVQTGEWYIALLILVVLFGCSIVLFVLRKRDIYNN